MVRVRVRPDAEEIFLAGVPADALGVEVASEDGDRLLSVFFATEDDAEAAGRSFLALGYAVQVERVEDGRWVEHWVAGLAPFDLGRGFTVVPGGAGRPGEGRLPLIIVPGRAFGTGEHATTELAAEMLEAHVVVGQRWLDLGCGTALLSMVALGCGAAEVEAIDNDPEAVRVAAEVLEANALRSRVSLALGDASSAPRGVWDGVVANIEGDFFLSNADRLTRLPREGGVLIASGILVEQVDEIASALTARGFEELERGTRGEWAVWVGRV